MIFVSVARLAPATPLPQARARVAAIANRIAQERAASRKDWTTDLIPLREYIVERKCVSACSCCWAEWRSCC